MGNYEKLGNSEPARTLRLSSAAVVGPATLGSGALGTGPWGTSEERGDELSGVETGGLELALAPLDVSPLHPGQPVTDSSSRIRSMTEWGPQLKSSF